MNPIELYAMRFVEETGGSWTAEQLRAAEAEIEQQKREWEANRLAAIKKEEEDVKRAAEEDEMLTYSREDAQNQVNNNKFSKRNPVNRRLLKVKQSERHGIVKNKKVKGRLATARQTKSRGIAQNVLGSRRALRNNTKRPVSRLAQSNSPKKSDDAKQSIGIGKKRASSMRIVTRMNKHPKHSENIELSSDDEPLIDPNKNNGVGYYHSKVAGNENDPDNTEQSECSDQQHSDDFDDSECSLDVMVDSTDPQESDEESGDDDDDDENDSTLIQSDDSIFDDTEDDATKENSLLNVSTKNNVEPHHQIDINSPRSTRSHGRIKINLWTLDESQHVPELCAKRIHNKSVGSKNNSLISNDACENGNGNSADDSATEDNDNNSSTSRSNVKQTRISDNFTTKTRLSATSTPTTIDAPHENIRTRKSLPTGKTIKIEKPVTINKTTISSNAKNHLPHIDMNRSPKVLLNKHDVEIQKARLKSTI